MKIEETSIFLTRYIFHTRTQNVIPFWFNTIPTNRLTRTITQPPLNASVISLENIFVLQPTWVTVFHQGCVPRAHHKRPFSIRRLRYNASRYTNCRYRLPFIPYNTVYVHSRIIRNTYTYSVFPRLYGYMVKYVIPRGWKLSNPQNGFSSIKRNVLWTAYKNSFEIKKKTNTIKAIQKSLLSVRYHR